jgi:hypothetical protein
VRYDDAVAENVRPPVAIRIVRPYESEDELLEHELETVGKTSVVLIGAHPRPTGVILRFEVTLASGLTVLRGEGRVLAHKENAFRGQPGLTLRFTRLDPRSKAVVDRATSMREARQQEGASPSRPAPRAEGALADALTASTPAPSATSTASITAPTAASVQEEAVASARSTAREKANATARANAKRTGRTMDLTPPPVPAELAAPAEVAAPVEVEVPAEVAAPAEVEVPVDVPSTELLVEAAHDIVDHPDESPPPEPTPVTSIPGEVAPIDAAPRAAPIEVVPLVTTHVEAEPPRVERRRQAPPVTAPAARTSASGSKQVEPPPDRAELLARLRERAGKLPPERVAEILAARR